MDSEESTGDGEGDGDHDHERMDPAFELRGENQKNDNKPEREDEEKRLAGFLEVA